MGQINLGRVVLGGLLAGVVINVGETLLNAVVLMDQVEAVLAELGIEPVGGSAVAVYVMFGFVLGILTVWLYAAIRPRFGPGPGTALVAGAAVWFLGWFYPGIAYALLLRAFPTSLIVIGLAWALVEVLLAAVAGAWLYRERESTGAAGA